MNNAKHLKEILVFSSCKALGLNTIKTTTAVNPLYCGYTSVVIKPARGKLVSYLKANKIGSRGVYGGYEVALSDFVGIIPNLQSIEIQEAAIEKIAEILRLNEIKCRTRVVPL